MIPTTTLETSKLLKSEGFKSIGMTFYWRKYNQWLCELATHDYVSDGWTYDEIQEIPSPTTDELLSELPYFLDTPKKFLTIRKFHNSYSCGYMMDEGWYCHFTNKGLVECLALLWLHLRREGII